MDAVAVAARLQPGVVKGDGMAVARDGLRPHGMPRGADVHRPALGRRGFQFGPQGRQERFAGIVLQDDMFEDRRRREERSVVHRGGIGPGQQGQAVG